MLEYDHSVYRTGCDFGKRSFTHVASSVDDACRFNGAEQCYIGALSMKAVTEMCIDGVAGKSTYPRPRTYSDHIC